MHRASLQSLLGIRRDSCVALIGGGGKTTLMLALAEDLRAAGLRPVVTTTTRIWPQGELPLVLQDVDMLRAALAREGIACFGHEISPEGKLVGVGRSVVCRLLAEGLGPLLVEADGAAGRPLKMHAVHEPVVPACSTDLLIVAGVDAVGQPADERVIHRAGLVAPAFGWKSGEVITAEHVAALLNRMAAYAPARARLWFVLNKVDSDSDESVARMIASRLRAPPSTILLCARGRVVTQVRSCSAITGGQA